ncbi:hypothetical protein SAMN05216428_10285 [Nitrosospira sp. Nsp11]|uniref:hypothetical protein n=1 Tax=Nitrosospira sp. Nsp11 TaxID=1855338 RepID=UPI000921D72B|nr:hypothetical protein [Nitrosospira sp. Nsp11]SHL34060.1 hypothetical protein SAMN05216428_10285 [Nitrosospira sp. Nsp11]
MPIIAALVSSGFIQPALAVDRIWFGGAGDWGVDTNWSPTGVPGISDKAIINSGNSTLSFNTGITGLDLSSGAVSGTGNLTLSGLSNWTGGSITGGRTVNAGDTTWSGNTGANNNDLFLSDGTFNNTGTFTDTNAFNDRMVSVGTFNNSGTYNKQTDILTTIGGVLPSITPARSTSRREYSMWQTL